MNAALLLEHYARIADAPDAIALLRRFILDLAVRGKLVEQDPSDDPASDMLRAAKIREFNVEPNLFGWAVADVGQLLQFQYGKGLHANERQENAAIPVFGSNGVVATTHTALTEKPAIIVGRKGSAGALNLCLGPSWTTDVAYFVEAQPYFSIHYLLLGLSALNLDRLGKGVKPGLSRSDAYALPMRVPPLAEQHRIVAKVDELMALCDQLEAARGTREHSRDRFARSTLAKLNEPNPETFAEAARFALDNLAPLTARADQIKQIRQTILNLAVRGSLVNQDPDDEPASTQLQRISDERDALVRVKSIRRDKPLEPVADEQVPFEIPSTWLWSRIGEAALFAQYGTSEKSEPSERGVPVLTMGNIQDGRVVWGNDKRIPAASEELPSLYLKKFDLLYNRTNSAELVGKTGIYLGEDDCRTFASYLIRIRCSTENSLPAYVNLAMNAPIFRETQIVPLIKQQTGQANVNGTALKNMLVPFPPVAEQYRIVAKVDELLALCDKLEVSITSGEQTRSRLLEAVLHEALEPA